MRDNFANLMSEVCYDADIEPKLQSLQCESFVNNSTATDKDARLNVKKTDYGTQGLNEPSLLSKSSTRPQKLHDDY